MGKLINCFFYLSLFFLFFSCTNNEKEKSYNYKSIDTLFLSGKSEQISISSNENPVSFRLKINNRFPLSIADMIENIQQISIQKSISEEQAAWEFVTKNTFHSHRLTEKCNQHNSEFFINSVGGGLCESRATVLADLWRNMNFESRIINMVNYHVVAEVFSAGKWKMYDADNEIYYYNEKNEIASFHELREHPDWVVNPLQNYDFRSPYTEKNLWTEKLGQWYSSAEINTISWEIDSISDVEFSLPPNTQMTLYLQNSKNIFSISVELTEKSKGLIKLPFVPYCAIGVFSFKANDSAFVLSNNDTLLFHNNEFIKNFNITNVRSNSRIIYLVNPRLKILSETTIIVTESTEKLTIKTSEIDKNKIPVFLPNRLAVERIFLDSVLNTVYLNYLANSSAYTSENIDEYLNVEFRKFLDTDKSLQYDDKELLLKKFPKQLKLYLLEIGSSKEDFILLVNKYHPMSLCYLFASIRYDKSEFLMETWRKHFDGL